MKSVSLFTLTWFPPQVLKTLSFLSHSAKFTASGKAGFPKKAHKLEKKMLAEEQLYGELAGKVVGESTPKGKGNHTRESIYSPVERNVEQYGNFKRMG